MSHLDAQAESAYASIPSDVEEQTRTIATSLEPKLHVKKSTSGSKKPKRHRKARADESIMGVCDEVLNVDFAEMENRLMMPVSFLNGMWKSVMNTLSLTSIVILSRSLSGGLH